MDRFPGLAKISKVWVLYVLCAIMGYAAMQAFAGDAAVKNQAAPSAATVSAQAAQDPSAAVGERIEKMKNEAAPSSTLNRAVSFLGLFVFIGICYAMSDNRSKINWRLVAWGMGLQILFAVLTRANRH